MLVAHDAPFWWVLETRPAAPKKRSRAIYRPQPCRYSRNEARPSLPRRGWPHEKVSLFMFTAFCATIFAATQVFDTNTADAAKGNLKELEAIAASVVGGVILSGGFGSIVGVVFGAVIFGLVQNSVFYISWIDGSYYRTFLGTVLLVAALSNETIRKRFTGGI
ncbi:MAG: hypothetical protein OXC01_11615 [Immundisolibacterales bacterium]|nr:hypothetical protein [Immundisolibacterales bacterium]